jgi:hypothetical protein
MDPEAIARLIALGISAGTQAYAAIRAAHSSVPSLEEALAAADSNWDQVIANSQGQMPPKP